MINQKKTYDVVVVGGGMAGLAAAIASAKNNAKTLLVERHPYSGGALTAGMVLHIAGLVDHRRICQENDLTLNCENWIVKGLACEFYNNLKSVGAARGPHWDHEVAKIVFDQMLNAAGVDVLYGTQFFSATVKDKSIQSVELIYRTHKLVVEAMVFVDATGDGDLGASAGVEHYFGRKEDGAVMPSTTSYMVADVNQSAESIHELNVILENAWKRGEVPKNMRPAVLVPRYSEGRNRNELWCSPVRQWGDITKPWEYSQMEISGRQIGWEIFQYLKSHTDNLKDAYLSSVCHQIWPRESRHLKTHYEIVAADVKQKKRFDDVIARGGFYLDLHSTTPGTIGFDVDIHDEEYDTYFEIPYRSLVAYGLNNLLLAGRAIGADHVGHSAIRVMGTGIATGQSAGTAASLLVSKGCKTYLLDVPLLQKTLRSQNIDI